MRECLTTQNTIQRKGDCKIMSDKIIENNQVTIMGEIVSPFFFSHEVYGEGFYMVDVQVKRLSNSEDRIPLMISERLIDVSQDYTGEFIMVSGQFRSYNRHDEQKKYLSGKSSLSRRNWTGRRRTIFFWTVTYVNYLYTVRRRLEGRSRICCLQ